MMMIVTLAVQKKKSKNMVKSKPERKEKKMPKPRLKATVRPNPVKSKGKGLAYSFKDIKGKDSSQRRRGGTREPSRKEALGQPPT